MQSVLVRIFAHCCFVVRREKGIFQKYMRVFLQYIALFRSPQLRGPLQNGL